MNSSFVKTLIIINGIIFPIFAAFLLYKSFSSNSNSYDYQSESIIVGEELEKAKLDSLALQGLSYESPVEVYNSTNKFCQF